METKNFINSVSIGNAAEAKDTLTDMLSTRAFDALNARKIDIAQTLFNNDVVEEEVELTQEEYDQLDELSKEKYQNYLSASKKEVGKHNSGSQLSRYGDTAGDRGSKQAGKNYQDRELNTQNAQDYAKKKLGISTVKKHTPV